jgi:hypothetical protein
MRIFAIALAACMLIGGAAAQQCRTISEVDFRNSTISTVTNGNLRFHGGTFESKESADVVMWRWQIRHDATVAPTPNTKIRMLEIFGDHLSGTGSRTYLIGFRCVDGAVKQVFRQEGEGMRVVSLSPDKVTLKFGVWQPSDPHCCPSGKKTASFLWDAAKQTYTPSSQMPGGSATTH